MKWLSDVKLCKYKGIQQAGILYGYTDQYPLYNELVVHELMEKLNDDNLKIRKNAYWMVTQISKQYDRHKYLIPLIPILNFGFKEKISDIRKNSLETLLNLSNTFPKKIFYMYPEMIEHFGNFDQDSQIITLKIFTNFSKISPLTINDDFLSRYLREKGLSKYLLKLLIHKKSYYSIFPIIIDNLQYEELHSSIFAFIEESCKLYPLKIIRALKKTLSTFDPFIRQNSILIFQYVKSNPKIYLLIPEILKLTTSKIKSISRLSLYFLYDIHNPVLYNLLFYSDQLLKLRKSGDLINKIIISSILIDLSGLDFRIVNKIRKKLLKQLYSNLDNENIRVKTIATLGYSKILVYNENDKNSEKKIINEAIQICKKILRNYNIVDYKFELYYWIARLFFYLRDLNNAKNFLIKASKINKSLIYSYKSKILLILINFIQHLPKTALKLQSEFNELLKGNRTIGKRTMLEIETWNSIFDALSHFKIEKAVNILTEYYNKNKIINNWEDNFRNIIIESLNYVNWD